MEQTSFLDVFYNILFHPITEFRTVAETEVPKNRLLFYGLIFIIMISSIDPILNYALGHDGDLSSLIYRVPLHALVGVFAWLMMGGLIALLAYAFNGKGRPKTFLILSSFATLPWLLMGPMTLIKDGMGIFGVVLGTLGGLFIWLWTVVLFSFALGITYRLSMERVIIILMMPFAMAFVFFSWTVGFVLNIQHLLP